MNDDEQRSDSGYISKAELTIFPFRLNANCKLSGQMRTVL